MTFGDYISALGNLVISVSGDPATPVEIVANDSRRISRNTLFCAIKGERSDGHDYIAKAAGQGASCFLTAQDWPEEKIPPSMPYARVRDQYYAWALVCEKFFGNPAAAFDSHTVTGTNGKTSIAFILKHLFDVLNGGKTALQTTVVTDTLSAPPVESANTTPDAYTLQTLFAEMRLNGAKALAMEYSSHGLSQHRAGGTLFSSAIFTNLTGDHLDYHKTMENYYAVKRTLFTDMMKPGAPCVINIDDKYGKRLFNELGTSCNRLAVSKTEPTAFCHIKNIRLRECGTDIDAIFDGAKISFSSRLSGEHNVYNLVSAMTSAYASGLDLERLITSAESAPPAPGRLERFILSTGAHAFVDYAHTDDALLRVLTALHALVKGKGRIITVFGCGGDRDKTKRPRMGHVVTELSDIAIVTSDNPRTESPDSIIEDILSGISDKRKVTVIPDRAAAIKAACNVSHSGDLVLIAGKGHENYQITGTEKHPFSDAAELKKYCK